jgi:hypothetical protein
VEISYTARQLSPDELRLLRSIKTKLERQSGSKIKFRHFLIAGVIGLGCAYLASIIHIGFFEFIFGTIAFFAFAFIAFAPYELFKMQRSRKRKLRDLTRVIGRNTVRTCPVKAKRVAVAHEYEDEGDLFIIELDNDQVLFIWDNDYSLAKKFPCLEFEIYQESFAKLLGRRVQTLSRRVEGLSIDKKAKWNYLTEAGGPGDLTIEAINFDELVQKIREAKGK